MEYVPDVSYRACDDEAEQAYLARRHWRSDYRRVLKELPDGSWYWHLFYHGTRVNGGLSPTREDALADAGFVIGRHIWAGDPDLFTSLKSAG